MFLYHYFDKAIGPFQSLSDLSLDEAQSVLKTIKREKPNSKAAQRDDSYLEKRRNCEKIICSEFKKKGGLILQSTPYYMVVEHSPWLSSWYENSDFIKIPIEEFNLNTLSFTYGDSMPTFSPIVNDGKEYCHKVYTYSEIISIIDKYGLPQDWNDDGKYGPERYIEVHIWSDETISRYK